MIEGIDIFAPRDSGLPDLTKVSPAQIFNGSALASLKAMEQQYSPRKTTSKYTSRPPRALDPVTGKPVPYGEQPIGQSVVEDMLNGGSARARGHRRGRGGYSAPSYGRGPEPDLPGTPGRGGPSILLPDPDAPAPAQPVEWHPPMLLPEEPRSEDGLFPNPELAPKVAAMRGMPTILLEELKNLHLI